MAGFVHLNVHSEYSLVDGIVRLKPLVAAVKAAGMPAVALTDHTNLFGMVKFYRAALKVGVKPIIGAQILVDNAPLYARPTDIYMNLTTFPWLQEYYPYVADARDSFTTIQVERGCTAKHNFRDEYEIIDA